MELKDRLVSYFKKKIWKKIKLSNGDEAGLSFYSSNNNYLELTFSHGGDMENISFRFYGDGLIMASSDSMEGEVKIESMHHAGYTVDRALCYWTENKDDIGLEWRD